MAVKNTNAATTLPRGGAELLIVLSLMTVLGLLNSIMQMGPHILFAIGRDGLLSAKAAIVGVGGTPRVALVWTSVISALVILTGTLEQIIALYAVLFLLYYVSALAAVFVLRFRVPAPHRPRKSWGYPISTAAVPRGTGAFLIAAIIADPRAGVIAAGKRGARGITARR